MSTNKKPLAKTVITTNKSGTTTKQVENEQTKSILDTTEAALLDIAKKCVNQIVSVDWGWRQHRTIINRADRSKWRRPLVRDDFRQRIKDYRETGDVDSFLGAWHRNGIPVNPTLASRIFDNPRTSEFDNALTLYAPGSRPGPKAKEFDEVNYGAGGERRFVKLLEFDKGELVTPELVLSRIGCVPEEWEIIKFKTEAWEVAIRDETQNRECRLVAVTMRPRTEVVEANEWRKAAVETFGRAILPWRLPDVVRPPNSTNPDRMLEVAPIELHLGKTSLDADTGDAYNVDIAKLRFEEIINGVIERQHREYCDKCLLVIGNDFFNSEFTGTTTNGTPQTTEGSARSLFIIGLELYINAILALRKQFAAIDIMLCAGNHARNMEFFLYTALAQRFVAVPNIFFREDTKDTQAVQWGQCAIFFNHGDKNWKRTVQSIPIEFPRIWGDTTYRELHMGHLHSEQVAEEGSGLTVRRVSSPCGPDAWHYENRFIGALKRHQVFVWDMNTGLCGIHYIATESTARNP